MPPALPVESAVLLAVAAVSILWSVNTLVAAYHLVRYGHRSLLTIPALALHAFVSLSIASYALSGLVF